MMLLNHKLLVFTLAWWWAWYHHHDSAVFVVAYSETILLNKGCSIFNATSPREFLVSINGMISELRADVGNQSKHFATAQRAMGGGTTLYAMFQCRNYLSQKDCLACFDNATTQIRNCSDASGARVHYQGCFLRYETNIFFFDETAIPGNDGVICGNKNSNESFALDSAAKQALMDLRISTPQIKGFSAATTTKTQLVGGGGGGGGSIYAFAQCVETATNSSCSDCITVGSINLQSCFPNTDGTAFDAGCFLRYSTTPFFDGYQTIDLTLQSKQGGSSKKWGIVGGAAGGLALVMILLALFVWYERSKQLKRINGGDISGATELKGPVNYKYNDLKAATKNFSEQNKLGHGGFGDVYKGNLKNGKNVAVKKLILDKSNKVEDNFESEVKLISNVHHRNLVRLLGCCSKGPQRILVYEYMANRSLDRLLFGNRKGSLNWKQRYDIILGTARGLAYLHEEFHVSIIHRDIKTGNILLDDELQPKIADFGLARLLPGDQSHLSTNFAGTLGYTAPEYTIHGQLSEKADIYSYGIVVLEIISGQKSTEIKVDNNGHEYLLQKAWKLHEQGMHMDLVDKSLDPNEYDTEEVKKITEIALLCTQGSPSMRPTMSEVIILLKSKGVLEHMMQPTMPVFIDSNLRSRVDIYASNGSSTTASNNAIMSNATVSTSIVSAR